jgi:dephospho-CoA kinase
MKIVGLTGGIGSGKTTVAKEFMALGVPVYIADIEAKALMNRSKVIKRKLIALFGNQAYLKDSLNRAYLASKIFNDKTLLEQMNAIVHPKVAAHFKRWLKKQDALYIIKEVAILFENQSYLTCDYVITVVAPEKDRIKRVILRDGTTEEKVQAIMSNQLPDHEKVKLSDFVVHNTNIEATKSQVHVIHNTLLKV